MLSIKTIRYDWCLNKTCNCSCFEIDQEMDAILLIIGIVYGVCRIVIKSVQQCTYFLFSVNLLLVCVNYGKRTDVNFRSQKAKSGTISCLMWNIYLYFIILKLFTNFQNIIFLVKIVANATLNKKNKIC